MKQNFSRYTCHSVLTVKKRMLKIYFATMSSVCFIVLNTCIITVQHGYSSVDHCPKHSGTILQLWSIVSHRPVKRNKNTCQRLAFPSSTIPKMFIFRLFHFFLLLEISHLSLCHRLQQNRDTENSSRQSSKSSSSLPFPTQGLLVYSLSRKSPLDVSH